MQPVECEECGNRVLVEKFSPQQISVQWHSVGRDTCPRLETDSRGALGVGACRALAWSIDARVRNGEIEPTMRHEEPTHGVY